MMVFSASEVAGGGGTHLIAIDHEVVCGDQRLEHYHPAGVGGPLEQRVGQLGNVDVHLVGAVDQV